MGNCSSLHLQVYCSCCFSLVAQLLYFLLLFSLQVEKNFILPTGFRASYGFDGGRTIAVLAQYDAHGENGHANGHNLIAECAVGVALGVKAALESMEPKVQKGRVSKIM